MNRRPSGLQLSKALVGFLQYKAAEGLSSNTLCNYEHHLSVWLEYTGDVEVGQATAQNLVHSSPSCAPPSGPCRRCTVGVVREPPLPQNVLVVLPQPVGGQLFHVHARYLDVDVDPIKQWHY